MKLVFTDEQGNPRFKNKEHRIFYGHILDWYKGRILEGYDVDKNPEVELYKVMGDVFLAMGNALTNLNKGEN